MRKWMWLIGIFISLFTTSVIAADKAYVLTIDSAISPATVDYVKRSIAKAAEDHAKLIIIHLNTPGGLETSMRSINEAIITSPIPIATFVTPASARAASAGTFIMYASHIAAMAPGTNIGAASPVNLARSTSEKNNKPSAEENKAMNDASAYIRSLAQLRGRNIEWAESAVKKAMSISAEEAKKLKVIDVIASNDQELLQKIDGKPVTVLGVTEKLNTNNLILKEILPDWRNQFLSFITNPNIAYILMMIAIYGLFFELSNPGLVLPGVAGIIALLLVLYAFQLMPINYTGLTLILIGIAFMVFEIYVSSFGALGVGGVIAFIIGSIMLFDMQDPNFQITFTLIMSMSLVTAAFFFMVATLAIRSHKKAVVTGAEGLIGSEGMVINTMNEQVIVRVLGEIWEARSNVMLKEGQKIKVIGTQGLILFVEPINKK